MDPGGGTQVVLAYLLTAKWTAIAALGGALPPLIISLRAVLERRHLRKLATTELLISETDASELLSSARKQSPHELKATAEEQRRIRYGSSVLPDFRTAQVDLLVARKGEGARAGYFAEDDVRALEVLLRMRPTLLGRRNSVGAIRNPSEYKFRRPAHLIVVGSPETNAVARVLLDTDEGYQRIGARFVDLDTFQEKDGRSPTEYTEYVLRNRSPHEQAILFHGELRRSPYYAQQKEFESAPGRGIVTFNDFGLLAKFPNPFHPNCKVLLFAGVTGLGTWGAAQSLAEQADQLANRIGTKDFAALIWASQDAEFGSGEAAPKLGVLETEVVALALVGEKSQPISLI